MPKELRRPAEAELYPSLERWLKRSYQCFITDTNIGLRHSRVDVIGLRDVGDQLSGEVETIAIEVKRGGQPFATTTGQARGYSVYANRVYLAEWRSGGYSRDEIDVASTLGVGLIEIRGKAIHERLSSPRYEPVSRLQLQVFEKMGFGPCCLCDSIIQVGSGKHQYGYTNMTRTDLSRAADRGKGLVFWVDQVGERKLRRDRKEGRPRERRFLCGDCVRALSPQHA